jgi:hypothetical protein
MESKNKGKCDHVPGIVTEARGDAVVGSAEGGIDMDDGCETVVPTSDSMVIRWNVPPLSNMMSRDS